jgi:hypothetical protein
VEELLVFASMVYTVLVCCITGSAGAQFSRWPLRFSYRLGPLAWFVARGWIRLVGVTGLIASIAWHREIAQTSFSGVSGPTNLVSPSMAEG